ncbi:MAG: BolA/IbaG family iron-sulfur metabolism protein [Gammaproteobacteria bacterium]|nr:BolA/IbaG family iron-sulfur metabolism protein [Gammaproteobacteria bacterium]
MEAAEVKALIESAIGDAEANVEVQGNSYQVRVVGDCFEGLNAVKKQQLVYRALGDQIADGSIHAVTMQLYTVSEWQKAKKLML